jgi:hypothetical protein
MNNLFTVNNEVSGTNQQIPNLKIYCSGLQLNVAVTDTKTNMAHYIYILDTILPFFMLSQVYRQSSAH